MSVQLLDKTRKIGRLLHNAGPEEDILAELCRVTGEILDSNVLIADREGLVLGMEKGRTLPLSGVLMPLAQGEYVKPVLNERFSSILSTKENVNLMTLGFSASESRNYKAMLVPLDIAEERVGTIFLYRTGEEYDIDDIILAEYVSVVAGLEMQQSIKEEDARHRQHIQAAKSAVRLLSYAELDAMKAVLKELPEKEALLVTSRVAEKTGITRSVIVNALRKFESSGIFEVKSLGMKGTRIRVLNEEIYGELEKR